MTSLDRGKIVRLCNEAYGEDVSHLFVAYTADTHVLARVGHTLVGHGMIVTRWLQVGDGPLLRTAYVELVATAANYRNRGIGAGIMGLVADGAAQDGYDLAALCPADTGLYGHLGWEYWQGPLFIRPDKEPTKDTELLIPTPERTGNDIEAAGNVAVGPEPATFRGMAGGRGVVVGPSKPHCCRTPPSLWIQLPGNC